MNDTLTLLLIGQRRRCRPDQALAQGREGEWRLAGKELHLTRSIDISIYFEIYFEDGSMRRPLSSARTTWREADTLQAVTTRYP